MSQCDVSNIALPWQAPVTRTSTPYPGRPERALGIILVAGMKVEDRSLNTRMQAKTRRDLSLGILSNLLRMTVQACWMTIYLILSPFVWLNEWTETEKGLYLASSLRGLAQGVLGNQPRDDRQNYAKLVKALQNTQDETPPFRENWKAPLSHLSVTI